MDMERIIQLLERIIQLLEKLFQLLERVIQLLAGVVGQGEWNRKLEDERKRLAHGPERSGAASGYPITSRGRADIHRGYEGRDSGGCGA